MSLKSFEIIPFAFAIAMAAKEANPNDAIAMAAKEAANPHDIVWRWGDIRYDGTGTLSTHNGEMRVFMYGGMSNEKRLIKAGSSLAEKMGLHDNTLVQRRWVHQIVSQQGQNPEKPANQYTTLSKLFKHRQRADKVSDLAKRIHKICRVEDIEELLPKYDTKTQKRRAIKKFNKLLKDKNLPELEGAPKFCGLLPTEGFWNLKDLQDLVDCYRAPRFSGWLKPDVERAFPEQRRKDITSWCFKPTPSMSNEFESSEANPMEYSDDSDSDTTYEDNSTDVDSDAARRKEESKNLMRRLSSGAEGMDAELAEGMDAEMGAEGGAEGGAENNSADGNGTD